MTKIDEKNKNLPNQLRDVIAHSHVWRVKGLDCPNCARELENSIRNSDGINGAELDFIGGTVRVICTKKSRCKEGIDELGKTHGVEFYDIDSPQKSLEVSWFPTEAKTMALSGFFIVSAWLLKMPILFVPAMLIAGFQVFIKATNDLRKGEISMSLLMSIAAIGAFFIGQWDEGAMVLFLYSVARWLERVSSEKARYSIEALKLQLPQTARLIDESGLEKEVTITSIVPGQLIRLKAGDRIPLDGTVIEGTSYVDESTLSGESTPVEKTPGNQVFAGTWNQDGTLLVRVDAAAGESRFSRILASVERAQSRKTKFQGSVESFAKIYTPIVVFIALLIAVLPPLFGFGSFKEWLYFSLVLLVIACPCALVVAGPVTLVSALTAAAREGILVRGGDIFEAAAGCKVVAFDKTGTLTVGSPRILDVIPLSHYNVREILSVAASLEIGSGHPLATGFKHKCESENIEMVPIQEFVSYKGIGVEGKSGNKHFRFGKPEWAIKISDWKGKLPEVSDKCASVSVLADREGPIGMILFGDSIRSEARDLLKELKGLGIERTIMLSGDRSETACEFSKVLGIDECHGNLLPEEKSKRIEEIQTKHGDTIMVGDGVNDTPALVAARVGIAMGDRGSDAVLETSGVVIVQDKIQRIADLLRISQKSRRLIRQNIFIAMGLKFFVFALSLAGLSTLWMAVIADTGATVLVVMNGLRALNSR